MVTKRVSPPKSKRFLPESKRVITKVWSIPATASVTPTPLKTVLIASAVVT